MFLRIQYSFSLICSEIRIVRTNLLHDSNKFFPVIISIGQHFRNNELLKFMLIVSKTSYLSQLFDSNDIFQ